MVTAAAAGGLAFLPVTVQLSNNEQYHNQQYSADGYCPPVFRQKIQHTCLLLCYFL